MNPRLDLLQDYPFERLRALLHGITPAACGAIDLSIGEPRHAAPARVAETLMEHLHRMGEYPKVKGDAALRRAIVHWLEQRFSIPDGLLDADHHVLPVNGTREALFSIAQAVLEPCAQERPLVLMPNPFYQIYEGAALLGGGEPYYLNCRPDGQPDFDAMSESVWSRTSLLYINSPHNPTGAVLDDDRLAWLIGKARQYGFILASDECYSELYFDEGNPPPGLLGVCARMGDGFRHCLAFHSLSKRSNMPGARTGFVAGDPEILARFLLYRTYLGNATPPFIQAAATAAWEDETHVRENRARYAEKFDAVLEILTPVLKVTRPMGGFYLWPEVGDGERFTRELYRDFNVLCLPGAYLAREAGGVHPGRDRVRIALVADLTDCVEAATRIRQFLRA